LLHLRVWPEACVLKLSAKCLLASGRPDKGSHLAQKHNNTEPNARSNSSSLLKAEMLQDAILHSANFSCIATDELGVIQLFNAGAERMLGYQAAEVVNKLTPADLHDGDEVIRRAKELSVEFATPIAPGFDALVFKARRKLEDVYELTKVRKDGTKFPAMVSVTALRDSQSNIIGYLLIGTDNTARMQMQLARLSIQESEARAHFAQQMMQTGSWRLNLHDQTVVCSLAHHRIFGYETLQEPWSYEKFIAHVLPEDRDTVSRSFQKAIAERTGWMIECRIVRKDGEVRWIWATGEHQYSGENQPVCMSGVVQDVTASKQEDVTLLKAGALQNAIFNSANFSSIATDASGVIQIFNVGAERMLGYSATEVVNRITPADISDPLEVIARAKALSIELATPITPGFEALVFKASRTIEDIYELTYICKDGSRLPAVVSVTALRDDLGGIIGYLLIGTDNTARKQVEAEQKILDQRLRDQQFYTRSLIEANIDAMMATNPRGIITDVNRQMEALTGCTRDELIGAPFKNYFTDPDRAETGIKSVLSGGKVTDYELTVRSRNGKETVVSLNATTFHDRDRKLQGVFAAARDVTDRNRLESLQQENNVELEKATAAAETANIAKSDFLSSMSHELRSPLNAILGFAQLINSDSPPPTVAQTSSLDQILKAGWYLLALINEILDLAQVESGRLTLSLEPTALQAVMLECQAMIEPQAKKRGITLSFPGSDLPYVVDADRTRLKQVIINLLSNAIKYSQANGSVVVDCTPILAEGITPDRVRVSVRDTGAGLPADKLLQLFQPFNRLGQERSMEEGTGIGLVMSKRLVEMMGGAIHVESTVGFGSVFSFDLNNSKPDSHLRVITVLPTIISHTSHTKDANVRTLLYVEDNPANLMLVQQLIARRPDIRLLSAIDGIQGIQMARLHSPEVILMDINLPGISGVEALKILKESPDTRHIPIVALSANAMPRDIEKGLQAGFYRYLTKPIVLADLMTALESALEFAAKPTATRN